MHETMNRARNDNKYMKSHSNFYTNSNFKIWAEKWAIMK